MTHTIFSFSTYCVVLSVFYVVPNPPIPKCAFLPSKSHCSFHQMPLYTFPNHGKDFPFRSRLVWPPFRVPMASTPLCPLFAFVSRPDAPMCYGSFLPWPMKGPLGACECRGHSSLSLSFALFRHLGRQLSNALVESGLQGPAARCLALIGPPCLFEPCPGRPPGDVPFSQKA